MPSMIDRLKETIDKTMNDENLDEMQRTLYLTALKDKLKSELRAREQQVKRAGEKLFIAHFANGCPKCAYAYKPSDEEKAEYVAMREASNIKL